MVDKFKPAGTFKKVSKQWGVRYSPPEEELNRPGTAAKDGRTKAKCDIDDAAYIPLTNPCHYYTLPLPSHMVQASDQCNSPSVFAIPALRYTNLICLARRVQGADATSPSTTTGMLATAQRQTILSTDAISILLFVCRKYDAVKAENETLRRQMGRGGGGAAEEEDDSRRRPASNGPFTQLRVGGDAYLSRLRLGRTLGSALLSAAGAHDKKQEPQGNLVQRDHLFAVLINSSTHARQGETGAANAFCTKGLWPIIVEKYPRVKEDMEKALKPPTTASRSLLLASRMAASGAAHRVVQALKVFTFGCPGLTSAGKAKHTALDSVCSSALELGDIAPATSNLTAEQQEQAARDAAEAAPIDEVHRHDMGELNWEEVTRDDSPNDPTEEALDELGTARAGQAARASASTGLCHLASGLSFMLVLLLLQTTQLILDGDAAQTIVARLSTDAGKIPGAFGVDQHWCPVLLQVLGYGAQTSVISGVSCVLHRFLCALSPDRALVVRIWKGHDNAVQLKANFAGYLLQVLELIKSGLAGVRLLMVIPPFLWGGFCTTEGVEQAVGEVYTNGRRQKRWRPTTDDGWTEYEWCGDHGHAGTWRVPNIVKVPTSNLLYAITDVFMIIRFNLGFDGGTLFSMFGTSPSSAQPDVFTETAKPDMQKLYLYVLLRAETTLRQHEAKHGDASCDCRIEEMEHANHPAHNRRQQAITRLPAQRESFNAGADPQQQQVNNAYVGTNGDEDDDMAPMHTRPECDRFEGPDGPAIEAVMQRKKWTKLADDFVPPPGPAGPLRVDDSFRQDEIVRVPIVIKPYSRSLTDSIFDAAAMVLLKLMILCIIHFRMRTLECFLNLANAPLRALMKEKKCVAKIETNYNKRIKEMGSKHAVYQTKTGDVPRATSNGPNAIIFQNDFLKLRDFDLTQEGLRTGDIPYPSEYFTALQLTFLSVGHVTFVLNVLPRLAACALDWALAMELAFQRHEASDEDVRLFELHLRRHIYTLAELFNGGLCWYYFQGLKVLIAQFKETRWLVGNSQQCVEHSMQTVRQTVRHTVHGGVGAPKKGVDRATDIANKRANAPSEHKALWRNLLFHCMSAVRSFSKKAPEVDQMTFMGAWSLLCEKVAQGRLMVWATLNWQWRYCRAMVRIYWSVRAFHRINVPGQEGYYADLIKENECYWEPVELRNGTWADRSDRSKRAKLARQRRYRRRSAVYKQRFDHCPDVDMDENEGEDEDEYEDQDEYDDMSEDMDSN